MRRLCIGVCTVYFLLFSLATYALAAERVPLKVARVPIVIVSSSSPSQMELDTLERQIERALHMPLNGTLKAVEYLPEREVRQAFKETRAELGRKAKWRELAKPMAARLGADLVVLPVLTGYEQHEHLSWHWDRGIIVNSYAAWELCVYDARTDENIRKQASRFYNDERSSYGTVSRLALEALDQVLREARIKSLIMKALP